MASVNFNTPAELLPTSSRTVTTGNYLDFNNISGGAFTQQYLPELYEAEVERYGNRSIGSFLRMVGAEMPMASDQVIWSEQTRLHLSYSSCTVNTTTGVITVNDTGGHAVRKNQTILINDGTVTSRCFVTAGSETSTTTLTVLPYEEATLGASTSFTTGSAVAVKFFVYGSEFAKGSAGMNGGVTPEVTTYTNKPIILKDKFQVSGSDAAQIGWIEVSGEAGQSGYLWYMKAEGDTRTRFEDYLEMAMVEGVKVAAASTVEDQLTAAADDAGTQGLFDAIDTRGIDATLMFDDENDVISDFDLLCKELDKQGAIEENMLFLNRDSALTMDGGLAKANSYGTDGTSYGVFENSEDMALNLGFSGVRRGSYDFYKTDWKYLNNPSTRGLFGGVAGVLVPAGTSSVYDQMLGKNIRRPFLHVRYRASEADDRRMKSWVVGSVGGAANSDVDDMNVHYLSERCLITQAANNFVLFKS